MRVPDHSPWRIGSRSIPPRHRLTLLSLLLLAIACWPAPRASAQIQAGGSAASQETITVFLDCKIRNCDFDYVRTEVDFVDWVRDRFDAEVYILLTSEGAGGGGTAYTFDLLGQERFAGQADTIVYTSRQGDTGDEVRAALVRTLKMGLLPFLMQTETAGKLDVVYREVRESVVDRIPRADPWDYWVFSTRLSGSLEGEKSRTQNSTDGSITARRVTPASKITASVSGNYEETLYRFDEGDIRRFSHRLNGNLTWVKSLGTHWSAGVRSSMGSATQTNHELTMRLAPALEYSVFPYSEFTRRQFTIQYSVGGNYYDYVERTIFGKWTENRYNHTLVFQYDVKQPWGSANASLEGAQYFEDLNQYRIDLRVNWDIRIFRGLSFNINANGSRIHDQLYLPAGEASTEDVLLRIRRLQTGYDYNIRMGLNFTFGSIFNTVVNPRLDEPRRGFGGR